MMERDAAEDLPSAGYRAVGVSFRYAPLAPLVLDGVGLDLRRGSIHGVLGHNGAGKSTLLGILAGRLRPAAGHLEDSGCRVVQHSPRDALSRGVVAVYQELSLVPSLSVADNILVGRADRGACRRSSRQRRKALDEALEGAGLAGSSRDRLVGDLRFGERQQVEIARALSRNSRYLLLDEPTAGLDDAEVESLFSVLRRLKAAAQPVGILMINHHVDQIMDLCDRYTVIRDGRVVLAEAVGCRPRAQVVTAIVGDGHPRDRVVAGPIGIAGDGHVAASATVELRIEGAEGEGMRCGSLSVPGGQVHGLYGLEGAGQDALIGCLAGQLRLSAGEARLGRASLGKTGPAAARRQGVLLLSGDRARMVLPQMTVLDNVLIARVSRQGPRAPLLHRKRLERAARQALVRMEVRGDVAGPMLSLSGGNQQKAIMARAIIEDFQLLLLLEPTVGVDLGARRRIIEEVREIALSRRLPVLFASSDEDDLLDCCDAITVFRRGEAVATVRVGQDVDRGSLRRIALTHSESEPAALRHIPTSARQEINHA